MKRSITIIFILVCSLLSALPVTEVSEDTKRFNSMTHTSGSLNMTMTNRGYVENLILPANSNCMLYIGATWISAKKHRRDIYGNKLYWPVYPPVSNTVPIVSDDPLWNSSMREVLDTLTTVGYDGDDDIYESLPAYNPLLLANPEMSDAYQQYNNQDNVMRSILGYPAPRPFAIPDPLNNYCFSIPQNSTFNPPGFETLSAYYYDYCPFGTLGERDHGSYSSFNTHIPLGIAIHRESYAWPVQYFDNMIIVKNTVYNTSLVDTLFDVAIAEYVDSDIYPLSYGVQGAADDISGYVKGIGYEFAFSRDADGDGGWSTNYLGTKIMVPNTTTHHHAWYWNLGQGPDDRNPLNLVPTSRTANEKYWLATGRNPNPDKFSPIRPEMQGMTEYEQPVPNDTRYLNVIYGSQPGMDDYNDIDARLCIAPGFSLTYYTAYFVGNDLDGLKSKAIMIESFILDGLQLGDLSDMPCIPYLQSISVEQPNTFNLTWQSYSDPDHFEVKYKPYNAPASQWQIIEKPGNARSHTLTGINPALWYEILIASIYNPGPNEVNLESETKIVNHNQISNNDDLLNTPIQAVFNYPNPFSTATTISFDLKSAGETSVSVYNIKGQLVNNLLNQSLSSGSHILFWDGRDSNGNQCSNGVYFIRLLKDNIPYVRKLLILK